MHRKLQALQDWYTAQRPGGQPRPAIVITPLARPGWHVVIDLAASVRHGRCLTEQPAQIRKIFLARARLAPPV